MIDAYIGTIIYFDGDFVPPGWYVCDGRIFKVEDEPVLHAVIRAQYGGDDRGGIWTNDGFEFVGGISLTRSF